MNVLHINLNDNGGAAKASLMLHRSLFKKNIISNYLVLDNFNNYPDVNTYCDNDGKFQILKGIVKRHFVPSFFQLLYKDRISSSEHFSMPYSWIDITNHKLYKDADIVHLHNIAEFVNIPFFFRKNTKLLVWTLHDMFPFSGLLHVNYSPELQNEFTKKMANKYHEIMQKAVSSATNLTIVAPGNNIAKLANESNVFENSRIELINHGIDFGIFRKEEKQTARNILNLPPDKKIILTVCDDYNRLNKNFQILFDKLGNTLAEDKVILAVGNNFNNLSIPDTAKFIDFGFVMNDLLMKLLYSAADVTIVPSKFETFSLVTLESIACGTPVTAFDNSGPSEIIHHKQNGYLAKFEDFDELISGTDYCLNYLNNNANIRADEKYDLDMVSGNYIKLYDSLNA